MNLLVNSGLEHVIGWPRNVHALPDGSDTNLTKQNPTFKHERCGRLSLAILATDAPNERLSCTVSGTL